MSMEKGQWGEHQENMVGEVRDTGGLNYSGTCGKQHGVFFRKYLEDLVMDDRRRGTKALGTGRMVMPFMELKTWRSDLREESKFSCETGKFEILSSHASGNV